MLRYPFEAPELTLGEAIKLIAEVVYPNLSPRIREKRVRSRIRSHSEKGRFKIRRTSTGDKVSAADLFSWAIDAKGWSALSRVDGLPLPPAQLTGKFPAFSMTGFGVEVPRDRAELEKLYVATATALNKCQDECQRLRSALELEIGEHDELKRKDHRLRNEGVKAAHKPRDT